MFSNTTRFATSALALLANAASGMKIGYNFDGVLHTSVYYDANGQGHPTKACEADAKLCAPFVAQLKQIEHYNKKDGKKHDWYLVSRRPDAAKAFLKRKDIMLTFPKLPHFKIVDTQKKDKYDLLVRKMKLDWFTTHNQSTLNTFAKGIADDKAAGKKISLKGATKVEPLKNRINILAGCAGGKACGKGGAKKGGKKPGKKGGGKMKGVAKGGAKGGKGAKPGKGGVAIKGSGKGGKGVAKGAGKFFPKGKGAGKGFGKKGAGKAGAGVFKGKWQDKLEKLLKSGKRPEGILLYHGSFGPAHKGHFEALIDGVKKMSKKTGINQKKIWVLMGMTSDNWAEKKLKKKGMSSADVKYNYLPSTVRFETTKRGVEALKKSHKFDTDRVFVIHAASPDAKSMFHHKDVQNLMFKYKVDMSKMVKKGHFNGNRVKILYGDEKGKASKNGVNMVVKLKDPSGKVVKNEADKTSSSSILKNLMTMSKKDCTTLQKVLPKVGFQYLAAKIGKKGFGALQHKKVVANKKAIDKCVAAM